MKKFYVVSGDANGENIPYFFEMIWTPDLPVFDLPVASPDIKSFAKAYSVKADTEELKVDVLINDYLASVDFVELCESLETDFLTIPAEVILEDGKSPEKKYSFFV